LQRAADSVRAIVSSIESLDGVLDLEDGSALSMDRVATTLLASVDAAAAAAVANPSAEGSSLFASPEAAAARANALESRLSLLAGLGRRARDVAEAASALTVAANREVQLGKGLADCMQSRIHR
jgi:hypothetical protein